MTRLLLLLLFVLVGCGAPVAPAPAAPTAPAAATAGVIAAPTVVSIPAIGASSDLVALGLNPDGTLAVPPVDDPGQTSWYRDGNDGVIPGEAGPALVAGHVSGRVDGESVPGVFSRLPELVVGDEVWIDRADGTALGFEVYRMETYPKDALPWEEVAGDTTGAELRLITCGGALGTAPNGSRTYDLNVVVFARLA